MGSKSKSKSSTTTNQTDSRQFRSIEQGLTDEAAGLGSQEYAGNHNKTKNELYTNSDVHKDNRRYQAEGSNWHRETVRAHSGSTINMTDGGAVSAMENVAGFAVNAVTGGAFDTLQKMGDVISMISENNTANQQQSYAAVESILAEKQTDGDQDNQKTMLYVVGGVGGLVALLLLGGKKK